MRTAQNAICRCSPGLSPLYRHLRAENRRHQSFQSWGKIVPLASGLRNQFCVPAQMNGSTPKFSTQRCSPGYVPVVSQVPPLFSPGPLLPCSHLVPPSLYSPGPSCHVLTWSPPPPVLTWSLLPLFSPGPSPVLTWSLLPCSHLGPSSLEMVTRVLIMPRYLRPLLCTLSIPPEATVFVPSPCNCVERSKILKEMHILLKSLKLEFSSQGWVG